MTISQQNPVTHKPPIFSKRTERDFFTVVKERVHAYFEEKHLSPHGNLELYLKTAGLVVIYLFIYLSILSDHYQGWALIGFYGALGIAKGLMGFNLTHDALHNAYTSSPWLNKLLGYSFDFNGTSSYVWIASHNVSHHTYTNIPGVDLDIEKGAILRFSPKDKLYPFHYYQNWYAPFLYCFTSYFWVFVSDYQWFWRQVKAQKVKIQDVVIFLCFKAANFFLFILFPMLYLSAPWWQILIGYSALQFMGGFTITMVFQLAHLVEGVKFPEPDPNGYMENSWAVHEMITTSNFATQNRFLSYLFGGLNFQVEHHLFPRIAHVHYPEISKIVKKTAREFGIPYNEIPTLSEAIKSHFRTLKKLGRQRDW